MAIKMQKVLNFEIRFIRYNAPKSSHQLGEHNRKLLMSSEMYCNFERRKITY